MKRIIGFGPLTLGVDTEGDVTHAWVDCWRLSLYVSSRPVWGWHFFARGLGLPSRRNSLIVAGRFFNFQILTSRWGADE